MDRKLLGYAEQQIQQVRDDLWRADYRDTARLPMDLIHLADGVLSALAAIRRSDADVLEDAERWVARQESRIEELTEALRWCEGVFTNPRADEELREGWAQYVAPLLPKDDDGDGE